MTLNKRSDRTNQNNWLNMMVKSPMEVFNIKIGFGENELTLTILPTNEGYYKVIYYGGILGAVRLKNDHISWEKVPDEELEAGDLPLYKHDLTADRLDIILDKNTVQKIGEEIQEVQ